MSDREATVHDSVYIRGEVGGRRFLYIKGRATLRT